MDGLFIIRKEITLIHLLLLMGSLPFDLFYSHLILISLIIHTMIQFKKVMVPVFSMRTVLLASVFLVTVCSTIYAANRVAAYTECGRQVMILIFPLLFCFLELDLRKYRPFLLLGFSLICTATVAYLYVYAVFTIRYYGLPLSSLFSHAFTNHNFSAPIEIHATFFSMQLALALMYLLTVILKENRFGYKLLLLVCLLILSAGLLQLSSKSVCFCLFLSVNFVLPHFLYRQQDRSGWQDVLLHSTSWKKYMLVTAVLSITVLVLIFKLGTFKERFIGQLHSDLSQAAVTGFGDPRLARWKVAAELIVREPFAGYGAGSEIPLLANSFFEHRFYRSYLSRLNAHNEYLSFLLKSGFTGLVIYLLTLGFGLRMAVARRDLLFCVFILLVAFVSISENLLDVNKGIIFYAFFFSFFVFSASDSRELRSG